MKQFRFLEWEVYESAQQLFSHILTLVKKLSKEHRYDLGSQIVRASLSVILNIAEGSGKSSDRELNRYLEIALGSLYETLAGVDTLRRNGFLTEKEFSKIKGRIASISKQLGGFKKKITSKIRS